jgi:hypothetical protein
MPKDPPKALNSSSPQSRHMTEDRLPVGIQRFIGTTTCNHTNMHCNENPRRPYPASTRQVRIGFVHVFHPSVLVLPLKPAYRYNFGPDFSYVSLRCELQDGPRMVSARALVWRCCQMGRCGTTFDQVESLGNQTCFWRTEGLIAGPRQRVSATEPLHIRNGMAIDRGIALIAANQRTSVVGKYAVRKQARRG